MIQYLFQIIQKIHRLEANVIAQNMEIYARIDELMTSDKKLQVPIVKLILNFDASNLSQHNNAISGNPMNEFF